MTELHQVAPDLEEIGRLNARVTTHWLELALPPEHELPVTLALEEILSNVIRHSGATDISVRFTFEAGAFEFTVADNGPAYNPLAFPPLDPTAPLDARRPGGMGVHIVRHLADELRYEYLTDRNTLLFRKQWFAPSGA